MASQISLQDALASLKSMFPSYDEDVLRTLLVANNNHIERTIESVLRMEGEAVDVGNPSGVEGVTNNSAESKTSPPTGDLLFGTEDDSPKPKQEQQATSEAAQIRKATSIPSKQTKRGFKVVLPEDFLRPPGWRENNLTLGDEQLAIMLHNEMFRKEVARNMGDDFVSRMRANGTREGVSSTANQSKSKEVKESGVGNAVPDMGILKGLSSLSAGAKRNLSALAAKFETKNNSRASADTGIANYDETSPRSNVRRSLLAQEEEDDDEEEEIVFGNNPRSHRLDERTL